MECRLCKRICDSSLQTDGVFWIPVTNQYFTLSDISNRDYTREKVLFYCIDCFRKHALEKFMSRVKCGYCHVYDNYEFDLPKVTQNKTFLQGNPDIGNFKVIKCLPGCINDGDRICLTCLLSFKQCGLIKRIKGTYRSELLPFHVLRRSNEFTPDPDEVEGNSTEQGYDGEVCDVCMRGWDDDDQDVSPYFHPNKDEDLGPGYVSLGRIRAWGQFALSSDTFTYGLYGCFKTKQPVEFKSGKKAYCLVCNVCLKNVGFEPYCPVQCGMCNKMFQQLFDDSCLYGNHCASIITEMGISCGYGSDKHYDEYFWVDGIMPDIFRNVRTVCDDCLDCLIDKKIVALRSSK